jgi:cell division protein FtsB
MRKRWFLVGMIFLLAPWLFGGCGIAQEQFDATVADLVKAQQEMQTLKAAHDKLFTENKDLQAEKTSLMTEKESLEADYSKLKTENAVVTRELVKIKESYEGVYQELVALQVVYPPKYFSTSQELESWIQSNAISDTPIHSNFLKTYKAYERCLEIQEIALGDGFIISVAVEGGPEKEDFPDYYGAARSVYCQAETSDGIYWWLPDRDEIELIEFYGKIEANFAGNPTHGIAPLTVNFNNLSKGEISSVHWEFGDGETSRTRHPTHTYTLPSIYTVSLKVTGPDGSHTKMIHDYIYVN